AALHLPLLPLEARPAESPELRCHVTDGSPTPPGCLQKSPPANERCSQAGRAGTGDRILVRVRQQLQLPERYADRGGGATARRPDRVEAIPSGANLSRFGDGELALRAAKGERRLCAAGHGATLPKIRPRALGQA